MTRVFPVKLHGAEKNHCFVIPPLVFFPGEELLYSSLQHSDHKDLWSEEREGWTLEKEQVCYSSLSSRALQAPANCRRTCLYLQSCCTPQWLLYTTRGHCCTTSLPRRQLAVSQPSCCFQLEVMQLSTAVVPFVWDNGVKGNKHPHFLNLTNYTEQVSFFVFQHNLREIADSCVMGRDITFGESLAVQVGWREFREGNKAKVNIEFNCLLNTRYTLLSNWFNFCCIKLLGAELRVPYSDLGPHLQAGTFQTQSTVQHLLRIRAIQLQLQTESYVHIDWIYEGWKP